MTRRLLARFTARPRPADTAGWDAAWTAATAPVVEAWLASTVEVGRG